MSHPQICITGRVGSIAREREREKLSFDDLRLLLKCSIRQTMTAKKRDLRAIGVGVSWPTGSLS
jgi:hypothetical protein